jgi:hypothetical protein
VEHPLDGALLRLDRANVHLDELKASIEGLRRSQEKEIFAQEQFKFIPLPISRPLEGKTTARVDIPLIWPILTGEVAYHLRSALDYLIFELAKKDSGSERDRTQFPIESFTVDSPNENKRRGFAARKDTYLAGLNQAHIDAIETLQPYKGVNWTKTLQAISNPDKHRKLTAVLGRGTGKSTRETGPSGSFDYKPGQVFRGSGAIYTDDYFNLEYTLDVTLADGMPLIVTLDDLVSNVCKTIELFYPEF